MSTKDDKVTELHPNGDGPTDEVEKPGEEEETDAGRESLFDKSAYDDPALQLAKVDGQGIDKIKIGFSGSVTLDRSDPEDVALFRRLSLGRSVTLRVEGTVANTSTGWSDKESGDEEVVSERKIKVTTVYVVTPEEM